MWSLIQAILGTAASSLRSRRSLALENLALRQQIGVLRRTAGGRRVQITRWDQVFWVALADHWDQWKCALDVVRPATVIRWHREGFGRFWRRRSCRRRPGRPPVDQEVVDLIKEMARANLTWGAPRIRNELAMLGIDVAVSTVAKYMPRRPRRPPSSTWRAFLSNHLRDLVAVDFHLSDPLRVHCAQAGPPASSALQRNRAPDGRVDGPAARRSVLRGGGTSSLRGPRPGQGLR